MKSLLLVLFLSAGFNALAASNVPIVEDQLLISSVCLGNSSTCSLVQFTDYLKLPAFVSVRVRGSCIPGLSKVYFYDSLQVQNGLSATCYESSFKPGKFYFKIDTLMYSPGWGQLNAVQYDGSNTVSDSIIIEVTDESLVQST